jgi:Fur family zinc uptake transcriptional regulator
MSNSEKYSFTLTSLRKDILAIIKSANMPLKAYDILDLLLKKRPTAKPPTVYRVLDFLVEKHILHKITSNHTYVMCQAEIDSHCEQHGGNVDLMLVCKKCHQCLELVSSIFSVVLNQLAKQEKFAINENSIELQGICNGCSTLLNVIK